MSSLTRAVTSRINEFTSGRQRLTTEKEHLPTPTSEFNYIIPPEIIWEDYQAQHKEPLQIEIVEPEQTVVAHQKKSSPANFSQKVTAVVRKLSPFTDDSSSPKSTSTNGDDVKKPDEKNLKTKNGKKKKTKKSKDREQLIDSSDDEF